MNSACSSACCARGRPLQAAAVASRQQADIFAQKIAQIIASAATPAQRPAASAHRSAKTEVNSWFAYSRGSRCLPEGVTEPRITIVGNGTGRGQATVDLERSRKKQAERRHVRPLEPGRRQSAGERSPACCARKDGMGSSSCRAPTSPACRCRRRSCRNSLGYYSRTACDIRQGVSIDDAFQLPATIRQIDVGAGQLVDRAVDATARSHCRSCSTPRSSF